MNTFSYMVGDLFVFRLSNIVDKDGTDSIPRV